MICLKKIFDSLKYDSLSYDFIGKFLACGHDIPKELMDLVEYLKVFPWLINLLLKELVHIGQYQTLGILEVCLNLRNIYLAQLPIDIGLQHLQYTV